MTHDELVRFAASKLDLDHGIGAAAIYPDEMKAMAQYLDLTSPELFLKSLDVCPHRVAIKTSPDANERSVSIFPREGRFAMKWYDKVEEIPLKFWEGYFELEGGQG